MNTKIAAQDGIKTRSWVIMTTPAVGDALTAADVRSRLRAALQSAGVKVEEREANELGLIAEGLQAGSTKKFAGSPIIQDHGDTLGIQVQGSDIADAMQAARDIAFRAFAGASLGCLFLPLACCAFMPVPSETVVMNTVDATLKGLASERGVKVV